MTPTLEQIQDALVWFSSQQPHNIFYANLAENKRHLDVLMQSALTRPAVPDGYALVPIEPTDEMINAALDCHYYKRNSFQEIYKAMISTAPHYEVKNA